MTQDVITSATKEVADKTSDVRVERSAVGVLRARTSTSARRGSAWCWPTATCR